MNPMIVPQDGADIAPYGKGLNRELRHQREALRGELPTKSEESPICKVGADRDG